MKITSDLVVFITGGASGLGLETVKRLHSQGAKVAVADMNEKNLEVLKGELKERILCFKCDVSVESQVKDAIQGTVDEWGTIHVALAAAGVAWAGMTLTSKKTLDMDLFKKLVDINLYGSMYVAKYASQIMAKNAPLNDRGEKGLLLFVSSVAAEEGQRGQVAYAATKGALNGLVLPMARDLGKFNIRCVTIAPGVFQTPIMSAIDSAGQQKLSQKLASYSPMNRLGLPDEFALFVQSIVENSYINGVHLRIDGATKLAHL